MAEATVNEIVEAVKEAVDDQLDAKLDEKLAPFEERLSAIEGSAEEGGEEEGAEKESKGTESSGSLDEEAVKELIKAEVAEATKASNEEVEELKDGLEKILSSRKSIDDEPDGESGDGQEPAKKSAPRRDPYGRRVKARS